MKWDFINAFYIARSPVRVQCDRVLLYYVWLTVWTLSLFLDQKSTKFHKLYLFSCSEGEKEDLLWVWLLREASLGLWSSDKCSNIIPFSSLSFPSLPFPSLPLPSLPLPSVPFPSLPVMFANTREFIYISRLRNGTLKVCYSYAKTAESLWWVNNDLPGRRIVFRFVRIFVFSTLDRLRARWASNSMVSGALSPTQITQS